MLSAGERVEIPEEGGALLYISFDASSNVTCVAVGKITSVEDTYVR